MPTYKRFWEQIASVFVLLILFWSKAMSDDNVKIETLNQMSWNLTVGLFKTSQENVKQFLRQMNDKNGNQNVVLSISPSHTEAIPDMPGEHEILVIHGWYQSEHLEQVLPVQQRQKLATSFEFVFMGIPGLRGCRQGISKPISVMTTLFTNSPRPVYVPFFSSDVVYVDELLSSNDGIVTLIKGDDVLTLRLERDTYCHHDSDKKEDDFRALRDSLWTSYPGPFTFDWSICKDAVKVDDPFCKNLEENESKLSGQKDFCVSFHKIIAPKRCGSSMEITTLTGVFREVSLITDPVPLTSFETERVDMLDHAQGLVFPCLHY